MMKLLFMLLLTSCTHLKSTTLIPGNTPWCVPMLSLVNKKLELGLACAETRETCLKIMRTAEKYGPLAGVKKVGQCTYRM